MKPVWQSIVGQIEPFKDFDANPRIGLSVGEVPRQDVPGPFPRALIFLCPTD